MLTYKEEEEQEKEEEKEEKKEEKEWKRNERGNCISQTPITVIKYLSKNKSQGQMASPGNSTNHLKKN